MNLRTAFFIWLKGVGFFALPCVFFPPIGLLAFFYSFVISWPAIALYALLLWVCNKIHLSFWPAFTLMLLAPTIAGVGTALWLFNIIIDDEFMGGWHLLQGPEFFIPLFCCLLAVAFSHRSIALCLAPEMVETTIESNPSV